MAEIIPHVPELAGPLPKPVFYDSKHHLKIYQGDCLEILAAIPADCIDLIFADPPYFLSNNGTTCLTLGFDVGLLIMDRSDPESLTHRMA